MIRDLVNDGLSKIKFREEGRERVAEVLIRTIEAAVQAKLAASAPTNFGPHAPSRRPNTPAGRATIRAQPRTPVPPEGDEEDRPLRVDDENIEPKED
jgi:hypothetical protein